MSSIQPSEGHSWPLERVLFAFGGSMTLLSAGLSAVVSPWFLTLTAIVGINQWMFALKGACPASVVLRRVFSLRSAIFPEAGQASCVNRSDPRASRPASALAGSASSAREETRA
ncbi:MAG TPA: hypothetical protein VGD00_10710 [Solirubrobacteraceae bacterium]